MSNWDVDPERHLRLIAFVHFCLPDMLTPLLAFCNSWASNVLELT